MTKCETCKEDITVDMMEKYDATSCGHLAILLRKPDGRAKVYLKSEQGEEFDWNRLRENLKINPWEYFVEELKMK